MATRSEPADRSHRREAGEDDGGEIYAERPGPRDRRRGKSPLVLEPGQGRDCGALAGARVGSTARSSDEPRQPSRGGGRCQWQDLHLGLDPHWYQRCLDRSSALKWRQGRVPKDGLPGCGGSAAYASCTQSHSSGLVSRGSMISSTPNRSAVRNGLRTESRRARISASNAAGSSALSRSARYAASIPPSTGSDPQSADGHAQRRTIRWRFVRPAPPTPKTRRTMISAPGTPAWYTALIARTPWRIVARCSALVPISNPG